MRNALILLTLQLLAIPMVTSGGEIYGRLTVRIKSTGGMSKEGNPRVIEEHTARDSTRVAVSRKIWEIKARRDRSKPSEEDTTYSNTLGEYRLFLKGQGRCTFEVFYKKGNPSGKETTWTLRDTSCFSPEGSEKYDWVIVDTAEAKNRAPLLKRE